MRRARRRLMHGGLVGLGIVHSLVAATAVAASGVGTSSGPRQVNITSDSEAGWLPSVELEARAVETSGRFVSALQAPKFEASYAMLAPELRADATENQWATQRGEFAAKAGRLVRWQQLKLTWTKNPANAPAQGIYAAIDFAATFARIDRYCGYVVLYAPDEHSPFRVMRIEETSLTNEDARKIAAQQSEQELQRTWAQTAARFCPNYAP